MWCFLSLILNCFSFNYSFTFVVLIKNLNLSCKYLVFYDITSLLSNVLLQETNNITINLILNINPNLYVTGKKTLKIFTIAISQTHFSFMGKFYIQIDGVAICSFLVSALINIFLGYQITKWSKKSKLYLRYIDGIISACDKEENSLAFFSRFLHEFRTILKSNFQNIAKMFSKTN